MKLRKLAIGLLACAAVAACKQDEPVVTPALDVDKESVSLAAEAGEASFNVTTNQDWTASADADWVSVDPASGKASEKAVTVKVTAEDNTSEEVRTAKITVKAGELTRTVSVSQAAAQGEEPEPAPVENSWGLMGNFVDNVWVSDIPMTQEGEWIVAKGAQFTELTFKIRANGSWSDPTNIGVAPGSEKGLVNAKISVVTAEYSKANFGGADAADIKLDGEAGTYDVYFSFENLEVWVMTPGYKPGDDVPAPVEPDGTEENPYLIKTADDMVQMRTLALLDATTYFRMVNDVDMASVKNWTPVNYDQNFTRQIHFDGNGKTITNFAPEAFVADDGVEAAAYPSLFGVLYGSCRDLTIRDSRISVSETTPSCGFLGGYVGTSGKPALVENVHIQGEISGGSNLGGFGGQSREGTFINCSSDVKIICGGTDAAGFVGKSAVSISFENCTAKVDIAPVATVTKNFRYGGILGYATGNSLTVTSCSTEGKISNNDNGVNCSAGIVAYVAATSSSVTKCSSAVSVTGNRISNSGGICGTVSIKGGECIIENCCSDGNLDFYQCSAGVIGRHENGLLQVKNCYSKAVISGFSGLSGIIGQSASGLVLELTGCLAWNPSITATRTSADKYSSGAVAGSASGTSTFSKCARSASLVLADPFRTIEDHEDITSATQPGDANQNAYDAKPSSETTLSAAAKAAGWDESVWDLSGDTPVLK